jgi:hypothetical protein
MSTEISEQVAAVDTSQRNDPKVAAMAVSGPFLKKTGFIEAISHTAVKSTECHVTARVF